MTRFILIDSGAASDITSERALQSVEFSEGQVLAELLCTGAIVSPFSQTVRPVLEAGGLYLIRPQKEEHFLVFDLEQANPFGTHEASEGLVIFQRILRFAIKIWSNLKLSRSERLIPESTKAVIFPFPITTHSSYRLTIERHPDERRTARRSTGNHLLVFREGTDEGQGADEQPSATVFRLALKNVNVAKSTATHSSPTTPDYTEVSPISVTELQRMAGQGLSPHIGYDAWLRRLTVVQRGFVERPVRAAERIEGPAGTGKTLCLVLRCIHELRMAAEEAREHRAIFVAHSGATERTIHALFETNDPQRFFEAERYSSLCSVWICTLQEWCASPLGGRIQQTEYLDIDAMESKELRLLYVNEALEEAMSEDFGTHKAFLSPAFAQFLEIEGRWVVAEMMQHEIAVMIKGRADESLDIYRKLPYVRYSMPLQNEADRGFVFIVFSRYQRKLRDTSQFDTDDIVLTAIGQLHTPIWRRRRSREAYDAVFVDETHLFNINELSVFHYMTRAENVHPIIFSVDRSQSSGDRGLTNAIIESAIAGPSPSPDAAVTTAVRSVFRCSPGITAVALSVTSSGATLFTNFENPLAAASSLFTQDEEAKCAAPTLTGYSSDMDMVRDAFMRAERLVRDLGCTRADILIVGFSHELLRLLELQAESQRKPFELIKGAW